MFSSYFRLIETYLGIRKELYISDCSTESFVPVDGFLIFQDLAAMCSIYTPKLTKKHREAIYVFPVTKGGLTSQQRELFDLEITFLSRWVG